MVSPAGCGTGADCRKHVPLSIIKFNGPIESGLNSSMALVQGDRKLQNLVPGGHFQLSIHSLFRHIWCKSII